jgi:hypothetical protein
MDFSNSGVLRKKSPAIGEARFRAEMPIAWCQRPKNSHNRIITGIGTPSSQSSSPRPMFASINSSDGV